MTMHLAPIAKRPSGIRMKVSEPVGVVTCPNCLVSMPRISLKGPEDNTVLREAMYRCPRCDAETRRWIVL
jgi:hypothetical protein